MLAFALAFISGCKKEKVKETACIYMSPADTTFVNDTILFITCSNRESTTNWNFGDGTQSSSPSAQHAYTSAGKFTISETVISEGGTSVDSAHIIVVPAAIPSDYIGSYQASKNCAYINPLSPDSTIYPAYSSNITSAGGNAIVIHNMLNNGVDINASVSRDKVIIPQQINSGDTVGGSGHLSFDKQRLIITYSLNPNTPAGRGCVLGLTK